MKIRIREPLRFWVNVWVENVMSTNTVLRRQDAVIDALIEFVECGDAERYVRRDGKIGWRATRWLLDRLHDAELECEECDASV